MLWCAIGVAVAVGVAMGGDPLLVLWCAVGVAVALD